MTRNGRSAANASVPAWLGWKRNILYAALAALVSAGFIYQLTRPHSLLGGILGWELERIDDASRDGAATRTGAITWAGLFAQLERKMPTLPDARPRAGTAQLIAAVEAVQRGKILAAVAAERFAPAEDAATFNLVARLAYAWIRDRATPPHSPDPIARFHAMAAVLDAQPPATTSTLYNDPLHDAWRDVLQTAIRRQDVIASCVRNYRHFDIREHYAALPTIHATLTALARDLHSAGHTPQAETTRQWLDRAYMGLIDNERDYATRLLAAELLADVRAADFYTAAPNHHRPSKLREAFHEQAKECKSDLVDLYKAPRATPSSGHMSDSALAYCMGLAAATIGAVVALVCQVLAYSLRFVSHRLGSERSVNSATIMPEKAHLWISMLGPILVFGFFGRATPFLLGQSGSIEGYVVRLAVIATIAAISMSLVSARVTKLNAPAANMLGLAAIVCLTLVLFLEPEGGLWPALRVLDIGFGALPVIGSVLLLAVITTTVAIGDSLRNVFSVFVRTWIIGGICCYGSYQLLYNLDEQYRNTVSVHRYDEIAARLGSDWKSLLPPAVNSTSSVPAPASTRPSP
ncbi:MAG: hypothetical protein HBSAPP02_20860 [Phycisphaerae bacterium]|nr:MAG: hypothetical protein HRU71_05360 [Planctomycetia bacterium]GJQ27054.1 MAG: hypothetical protein HBSAPP02_20860 [Phycisphaerae bacterium]